MDFNSIATFVCNKVGKTDPFSQARALEYTKARHKMIYEGFDWKAAQLIIDQTILAASLPATTVAVPGVHHVLAVRLDSTFLDPVSTSFIFEQSEGVTDRYGSAGTPIFYEEFLDTSSGIRNVRFFPILSNDSVNHTLSVLGKRPYDESWAAPVIPATENALIEFVTGDMWEYAKQVGKAQAKFQEAAVLLQQAQAQDTPAALRPRQSKEITPQGNSLGELIASVQSLIGDFDPATRVIIRDRFRRNYQSVWDSGALPETFITSTVTAEDDIAIIPHLIEQVVAVRMNIDAANQNYRNLTYAGADYILGLVPYLFEQTGTPVYYHTMLPVGLPVKIDESGLQLKSHGADSYQAYIKGELRGVVQNDTIKPTTTGVNTSNNYDTILTIWKPQTAHVMDVCDLSGNIIFTLLGDEQERKYQRIRILPSFDPSADETLFVLGKRRLPQFLKDQDTVQLRGIENILIHLTAADMFLLKGKPEMAQPFKARADSDMQAMIDKETKQAKYEPRVLPYTEIDPLSCNYDASFLGR